MCISIMTLFTVALQGDTDAGLFFLLTTEYAPERSRSPHDATIRDNHFVVGSACSMLPYRPGVQSELFHMFCIALHFHEKYNSFQVSLYFTFSNAVSFNSLQRLSFLFSLPCLSHKRGTGVYSAPPKSVSQMLDTPVNPTFSFITPTSSLRS